MAEGVGSRHRCRLSGEARMTRQVLRPQPSYCAPIIVLSALGLVAGLALAMEFMLATKPANPPAAAMMAMAGLTAAGSCWASFRNMSIWFDDQEIGYVNLLGMERKYRFDELAGVASRFSPQPTLNFMLKDGSRAFRINTRWWTDGQLRAITDAVSQSGGKSQLW